MKVALFDLDGVILDTEGQYAKFWTSIGEECLEHQPNFSTKIKGMSLVQIYSQYFSADPTLQHEITRRLNDFELKMSYPFFPGVESFLETLREKKVKMAIVTSSNTAKMQRVYAQHPNLQATFDQVFTAEAVKHSKPAPDCYVNAAKALGAAPEDCIVFEDSLNGLLAGRSSGAQVVGVTTSYTQEQMTQGDFEGLCDFIVNRLDEFGVALFEQ